MQVPCVRVFTPTHHREQKEGQRSRVHPETAALCSLLGVLSNLWVEKRKKGKNGHVAYNAYLADFQKKLIIMNYAYIDTSPASQKENLFNHSH